LNISVASVTLMFFSPIASATMPPPLVGEMVSVPGRDKG
jgi:hypothetical protein